MKVRLAKLIFVGGVVVWIINAALWWSSSVTLGHDEARYASDTRELLDGNDKRYIYVPTGMNGLAAPGVLAGGDERAMRVLPILAGLLFLFAAWRFARRVTDEDAAYWTVGVLAGAHSIAKFNAQLLSDLPSTGCMLAALTILLVELDRDDGPRYRLVWVAPLLAAAFYIRYGSCLTIMLIGLAAIGFGARAIAQRPMPVVVTCLVFVMLLVPHVLESMNLTGSALGIMRASSKVPPRGGSALVAYFVDGPIGRYGVLIAPLMLVGALAACRQRSWTSLQLLAVAQIIVLGLTTLPQTRYIFFAIVVLVAVGVGAVRCVAAQTQPRTRSVLAIVAAVLVVCSWISMFVHGAVWRSQHAAFTAPTVAVAKAIRADARGAACEVRGQPTTQIDWYSGCYVTRHVSAEGLPPGQRVYAVLRDGSSLPGATILLLPGVQVVRFAPAE